MQFTDTTPSLANGAKESRSAVAASLGLSAVKHFGKTVQDEAGET